MELLTKEVRKNLPPLYGNEGKGTEAKAVVKFFTPDSNWTWWASEASAIVWKNGEKVYVSLDKIAVYHTAEGKDWYATFDDATIKVADVIFFGLVNGFDCELGYFSLKELESVRGPFGLAVERDLYFKPTSLSELQQKHGR